MPTAAQYSSWADALDEAAGEPAAAVGAVRVSWEAGPLIGGQERPVELAVEELHDLLAVVSADLAGLADECRRRAAVCAAWTAALSAADAAAADGPPGSGDDHQRPLRRPAPWAEPGP